MLEAADIGIMHVYPSGWHCRGVQSAPLYCERAIRRLFGANDNPARPDKGHRCS